jgi:hypothetical protein
LLQAVGRVPGSLWVVILTLPALAPLARSGFFESDDGLFHVYRLAALDKAVRAGALYPRWFPEFAFGYGHPVLNFYGPLSYYWGLPFTLLGADAALAMRLVFATGLVASALGMYLFARLHLDRCPAVVAALVYAYLPYHLADLYVRGAVAEFLAFFWLPLVLWAFHRLVQDLDDLRFYRLGLASLLLVALLVTHSLTAFIFAPVVAAYVILLLIKQRDRRALGSVAGVLALALVVSAFYWLPVLTEAQYVGLGYGRSEGYQDHLLDLQVLFSLNPTYPYPVDPSVARVFPLGLLQVVVVVVALVLVFLPRQRRWATLFFLAVALVSGFMLTMAALPVWRAFERGLAFLQYPWRFQALTALATGFLAGAIVEGLADAASRGRAVLCALLLLATGAWALWRLPVTSIAPDLSNEAMWQMDRDHGQVGATWTGEYLPIWVEEQRWAISHPLSESAPAHVSLAAGEVELTTVGYTRYDLALDASQGTSLVLHQFHYPGWEVAGEGAFPSGGGRSSYGSRPVGALGLAGFELPPGSGLLKVRLGHTPAQFWGTLVSLIGCLLMGIAPVVLGLRAGARSTLGSLLLAVCYLVLAAVLLASLVLPGGLVRPTNPVNANLEDTVELLAFATDEASYRPGDVVDITLYWRALRDLDSDFKAFVHLTDAAVTFQPAQHDGDPGGGFTPTTRWLPGELVPDTHHVTLPAELAAGRYLLWAGMYEYDTLRNLDILSASVPVADNRLLLSEIEVVAP